MQNGAARLITGTRRCDHISPVLRQLHWLPVLQRVSYKIVTLVHRCLSQATWLTTADSSPTPASDDCVLPTLEHWSSVAHKVLLATEHSLRWNSLPSDIRQSDLSYGQFQMVTSLGEVDLC